jgi:hypothetical protein
MDVDGAAAWEEGREEGRRPAAGSVAVLHQQVNTNFDHFDYVSCLAVAPAANTLVTAGYDKKLLLIDLNR